MNYDRELHNLIPVLNRRRGDRGDYTEQHHQPDSSQFLQRLEQLEHQLKHLNCSSSIKQQQ